MLYTPPVTPWELVIPEAGSLTDLSEGAIEGRISDWGEVVTRYPYRKVGMDHLLSMEYICRKEDLAITFCLVLRDHFFYDFSRNSSLKTE